jgi:hypothetical protein
MEELKYPIGKFIPQPFSPERRKEWLLDIETLPMQVEAAISNLDEAQLETPYRPGGWTVKQLVHHIADSHMNAYIRFKLGLSEELPTIKTYDENSWANMKDTELVPVNVSTTLLHALHRRMLVLLEHISETDFNREIYHPEQKRNISLWNLLGIYAWHSRHHVAHINKLREREGW